MQPPLIRSVKPLFGSRFADKTAAMAGFSAKLVVKGHAFSRVRGDAVLCRIRSRLRPIVPKRQLRCPTFRPAGEAGSVVERIEFVKLLRFVALALALLVSNSAFADFIDPYFSLSRPTLTNGQLQFIVWGASDACVIEQSTDLANWLPVATNSGPPFPFTNRMDMPDGVAFYRAVVRQAPSIAYAAAAVGNISLNGNGQSTDSFNSSDPNFSTNGQYDATKASTNGNLASVMGIVNLGNHTISGNLFLSPTATYTSSNSQVLGTIYKNKTVRFPDVLLPAAAQFAVAPAVDHSTNIVSSSGYFLITNSPLIDVSAGVQATLVVTTPYFSLNLRTHGVGANLSKVTIYLCGTNATLSGVASTDGPIAARNLVIYGLPSLTSITFGPQNFTAAIYAPEATVTLTAGGLSNNFQGSLIVKSLNVNGHFMLHFDEDLITNGL
jgi:hypothetical protein